jgi:hypothetical protein
MKYDTDKLFKEFGVDPKATFINMCPGYEQHPEDKLKFLYWDGDEGICIISFSEMLEDEGVKIEQINCNWFDLHLGLIESIRDDYWAAYDDEVECEVTHD